MADYHVSTGIAGIYAGRVSKDGTLWLDKSDVTEEAEIAVRDHMVSELLGGFDTKSKSGAYRWKLKDGRFVELRISIIGEGTVCDD